jgi:predicted outer membrane protein
MALLLLGTGTAFAEFQKGAVFVSRTFWRSAMRVVSAFLLSTFAAFAIAQNGSPKTDPHHVHEMAKQMRAMNKAMVHHLGPKDAEFEKRFIDLMIPHHEGAIEMAKHALTHSSRAELKEMARKMIEDQQKEVEKMKQWRAQWYGEK